MYALQARGLARPEPLPRTMAELAMDYLNEIRFVQPNGPYHLLGWSFGGIIAHLIATELQRAGEVVASLTMLDVYPQSSADPEVQTPLAEPRPAEQLAEESGNPQRDVLAALLDFLGFDPVDSDELTYASVMETLKAGDSALAGLQERHIAALANIGENFARILPDVEMATFDGDLLVFVAALGHEDATTVADRWRQYVTGRIEGYLVDCKHDHMTHPGPIAQIGGVLAERLRTDLGCSA